MVQKILKNFKNLVEKQGKKFKTTEYKTPLHFSNGRRNNKNYI